MYFNPLPRYFPQELPAYVIFFLILPLPEIERGMTDKVPPNKTTRAVSDAFSLSHSCGYCLLSSLGSIAYWHYSLLFTSSTHSNQLLLQSSKWLEAVPLKIHWFQIHFYIIRAPVSTLIGRLFQQLSCCGAGILLPDQISQNQNYPHGQECLDRKLSVQQSLPRFCLQLLFPRTWLLF